MKIEFVQENIREAARKFISLMEKTTIFAFHGEMGAGKTTFIKAVCEELGVKDSVNSPTFAIINEYESSKAAAGRIYHFDFYRLSGENGLQEVSDLGLDEYFDSQALCFIEWPEVVESLLPEKTKHVYINIRDKETRSIEID
jgi:tRNA threonylcarbamoyladenosine biosynthesis protein TsaE